MRNGRDLMQSMRSGMTFITPRRRESNAPTHNHAQCTRGYEAMIPLHNHGYNRLLDARFAA